MYYVGRVPPAPSALPPPDWNGQWEQLEEWFELQKGKVAVKQLQPKSLNNYVRALHALAVQESNDEAAEVLAEWVDRTQRKSTVHSTGESVLALVDPYSLVELRNEVVRGLRDEQMNTIDPMVRKVVSFGGVSEEERFRFGVDHFRCWLDLALRFTNVACRMQVTKELREKGSVDTVAYLSGPKGARVRVIAGDKVGGFAQPVAVPVGKRLSYYLDVYREHFRAEGGGDYVFRSITGKQWARPSRDVKVYLANTLGIPVEKLDPSGRFVHASRHMALATYAVQVRFDSEKLRNLAILMRHSLFTAEQHYNVWANYRRGVEAVRDLAALSKGDWEAPEDSAGVNIEELAPAPSDDPNPPPTCETCGKPMKIHGRLGNTRHPKCGCYFWQCCGDTQIFLPDTFELPEGVVSSSRTPRNLPKVMEVLRARLVNRA